MLFALLRSLRILAILAAFAAGHAARRAVLALQGMVRIVTSREVSRFDRAEARRLREALTRAGGTAVKLGQLAAMRPDVLQWEYVQELEHLLDDAPVVPGVEVQRLVESELGAPLVEHFLEFDLEPVSAASFAQVHRARLPDGTPVAVKVQRPGLEAMVLADIRILHLLATAAELLGLAQRVDFHVMLREFETWTTQELDFRIEACFADRLRENAADAPEEKFPVIHWSHTTRRVLTMELLEGVWMRTALATMADEGRVEGFNRRVVAARLFHGMMRQVFCDGLFHADPHAGNIVVLEDDRVAYVDFGITGELGLENRRRQLQAMRMIVQGDADGIVDAIQAIADVPEGAQVWRFRELLRQRARVWLNATHDPTRPAADKSMGRLIALSLRLARECGLAITEPDLLFYRAVTCVEMVVFRLDPDTDLRGEMRDFMQQYVLDEVFGARLDRAFLWYAALQALNSLQSKSSQWMHGRPAPRYVLRLDPVRRTGSLVLRGLSLPALGAAVWAGMQGAPPLESAGLGVLSGLLYVLSNVLHRSSLVADVSQH